MDEREALMGRIEALETSSDRMRRDASLEALLSLPLTVQQLKAMAVVITANGDATSQRISEILHVSLATVSGIVDRLVSHGVVERAPDERDRRSRRLVATDHGREMLHAVLIDADRYRKAAMARMPVADLRALVQGLEALTAVALVDDGTPAGDA
ncbi:MarR family winged helix-turn-helix transcriptional regulator [Arthrobacter sp. AOP36-C1-22]|uniref:MarR family winged helix-turn-helix transcriptional regulator n=1 Tax=Arthrobacter sp. AOP36-C1-22 TaxID=3457683 RepID=UPI0040345EC1